MSADDDAPPGLRERKKRETRLALSMATVRLSVERGWNNVTVEDIADAANVSVRTFRNYFASKADAITDRHVDRMRQIAEELRARPDAEPLWEAIGSAVRSQFPQDTTDEAPARQWIDGVRLMLTEPAVQGELAKANAAAQTALAEAVADRTGTDLRRDMYPTLVAAAVGAATSVAIEHWLRADPPGSIVPLLREALDQLAAGLPLP